MKNISHERALVKQICIVCNEQDKKTNKEHIFPQWLLKKTNTFSKPIRGTAGAKKIPGKHCVIPICEDCNSELGRLLEDPVKLLFERIEVNEGFNDYEAELLVRWMWKITGMFYWIEHAQTKDDYGFLTLKDVCTKPIVAPRDRISIAISLIENEYFEYDNDTPMGIDVIPEASNVLAAGVFNKLAIIVYYSKFNDYILHNYFTTYQLSSNPLLMNPNKRIKPITGFSNADEAVVTTINLSNRILLPLHENESAQHIKELMELLSKDDPEIPMELKEYLMKVKS